MGGCPEEHQTHHHLGPGHGPGLVQDAEIILMAIFRGTPRAEECITDATFKSSHLKKGEVSVARMPHTSAPVFEENVVVPGEKNQGQFVGVVCAETRAIREIMVLLEEGKPASAVRGICVIDTVAEGDHDGHASLKYADLPSGINETRKGRLWALVREDLANRFSPIMPLGVAYLNL